VVSPCDPELVRPGGAGGHPVASGAVAAAQKRGSALIPLTVPEVRKLLVRMVWDRLAPAEKALAWSE